MRKLSAELYVCSGNLLCALDEFERAVDCYSEAIQLQPKCGFFYSKRAVAWIELSKSDPLSDYNIGIRMTPGIVWALINRGRILAAKGDFKAALKDLDEALELDETTTTRT